MPINFNNGILFSGLELDLFTAALEFQMCQGPDPFADIQAPPRSRRQVQKDKKKIEQEQLKLLGKQSDEMFVIGPSLKISTSKFVLGTKFRFKVFFLPKFLSS